MEKRVLTENEFAISPNDIVKVTSMNHIIEVQYMEKCNTEAHVRKLDADRYVDLKTGEIKDFEHTNNRSEGVNSLRKTFNRLRELINANFSGQPNELFCTLTYRGDLQTNDPTRVYKDFKNFMDRFRYQYKGISTLDYINIIEPHASGKFHMHVLIRFNDLETVYIPNSELAEIWGNGYVTVRSLKNTDNIGAYLSAYFTDLEVPDDFEPKSSVVVEKEVEGKKKKFIKGGRLNFYPTGINIYRKSKGIKDAEVEKMTYEKAQKKVGATIPNFKYGVELIDQENNFRNTLIKEQYNLKR